MTKHSRASTFFSFITPVRQRSEPSPPISVSVHTLRDEAVVRWLPPIDDGGSPVLHYTVTVNPGGEQCRSLGDECVVESLRSGRRYEVTVSDSTAFGTSPPTGPSYFDAR
jgi:hypothetical protein